MPRSRFAFETLFVALTIALLCGCKTIPAGRTTVDAVYVEGNDKVPSGDIEDKIATTPTSKFLGLFRGVLYEYSNYDRFVLQRDLARIEAFYRDKGYYDAHARAGRVFQVDPKHVKVEILVDEGKPVVVGELRVVGLESLPADVVAGVTASAYAALPRGEPFEQDGFKKAEGNVRRAMLDRGHAYVKVKSDADVDLVRHEARVVFTVDPGPPCTFGDVEIAGLGSLPEAPVRRAMDLRAGAPYSQSEIDSAQQALLDLGVFASVAIEPKLGDATTPAGRVVPLEVKVEPTRLHTVRLGGGLEFDALKTDVHGLVGWEDRDFLGGLRSFSVQFRPGLVLYPLRIDDITAPNHFFPEERTRVELRQPGLFEARTTGFLRPELDAYPVLLNPDPPPNAPVLGYLESRNAIGADRTIHKLYVALSYDLQYDVPYSYLGAKDPTLEKVLISYPELYTTLDFRDDKVHPHKGLFFGNTLQVAGGIFGGDARDVKIQPEARAYVPIARGITFATRESIGLLYPQSYGEVVRDQPSEFGGSADQTHDYQVTFFRGFFSGGPTSNRGYPLRGVGPHAIVPFLSPEIALQNIAQGCGSASCLTPTGGFTLWEASAEVRFKIDGPISAATFCDASDVSPRTTDLRLSHPHLSCGVGGRYDTPAGPVRVDIGYRIPGLQVIGPMTPDEVAPDTFPFGIPIAIDLGIGEAY